MAIIYSYPKVTSPLATDVLVLTDTTLTAGKRKNKTKSLALSDLAAYVVSSTSAITGSGTTNYIPLWTDGPNGGIGDSQLRQLGPNANGVYQLKFENADRFIINKPSSVTSGDPEYLITQDGNFKVSMGWDDDGAGFGYLYNWAGDGWRFGAAGNNPELEITTTAGLEGVTITNNLIINGSTTTAGDLIVENGLVDGDSTYGTAGQVLSTTGIGEQVVWIDAPGLSGAGTTNTMPIWSDGPNGVLGDSPIKLGTGTDSLILGAGTSAIGNYSVATGSGTTASGVASFSMGYNSIASGDGSFAGAGELLSTSDGGEATGRNAFAFGYLAKATDDGAIAIGSQTEATATNAVALGNSALATDVNCFAGGIGVIASGRASTALGANTASSGNASFSCGDNTTASGNFSFAGGKGNTASGTGSIVMGGTGTGISTAAGEASAVFGGLQNVANGLNSTILGGQKNSVDINSQDSSVVGGEDNQMTVGSTNSVLLGGIGLRGGGINQTTCGVANISKNNCKFIVGVGTYTSPTNITRANGFEVRDNGQISLGQYTGTNFNPVATNSNDLLSVNAAGDVQQSRTLPRGIKVAPDPTTGTIAANVGAIRYRATSNNSYVEMIMQTSAFGYSWVIIKENTWS